MSQGIVNIKGRNYKTVALRVDEFRTTHPIQSGWALDTSLIECTPDSVVMRASIVNPEGRTIATGHAHETWESQINRTSAVENCETSAIGRALAAAGFGGEEYASANEVARAISQQDSGKTNRPAAKPKDTNAFIERAQKLFSECSNVSDFLRVSNDIADGMKKKADKPLLKDCLNQWRHEIDRLLPPERVIIEQHINKITGEDWDDTKEQAKEVF